MNSHEQTSGTLPSNIDKLMRIWMEVFFVDGRSKELKGVGYRYGAFYADQPAQTVSFLPLDNVQKGRERERR